MTDTRFAHQSHASAGLLMLLAALVQSYLAVVTAIAGVRDERGMHLECRLLARLHGRALTVLFVGSYLASLLVHPADAAAAVFAAVVSCSVATLAALSAYPAALRRWRRWSQTRSARRSGWVIYLCVLLLVGIELGGRTFSALCPHDLTTAWSTVAAPVAIAPASAAESAPLTEVAVTEQQLKALAASASGSAFRVAVLGDEMVLGGSPQANFLAQLEHTIPGVKIHNFGLNQAGPRQYAEGVDQKLTALRPDLVLAFVSLGDDFTTDVAQAGVFEWKSLWIAQHLERFLGVSESASPSLQAIASGDQQAFLQSCSPHLNVCRTPIDRTMHERWQVGLGHLDRLIARCRGERLNLALVAVPAEFQVNPLLCETLRRRAGYSAQDVDLQLPQRRLAAFAQERQLPLLDLLPYLQRCARPIYERNNLAWNDEGHAVAARAVSSWLQNGYGSSIAAVAQLSRHE